MLWLFFLNLVIHHSSYNEAQIEKAACKSQVGLVSLQERFCSTVEVQIDGHLESTKRPSLQRREVPRTSWSSNPNYVGLQGFLEVQGLQKSCEGDCGILCSLWKTLEWSLGSILCPYGWLWKLCCLESCTAQSTFAKIAMARTAGKESESKASKKRSESERRAEGKAERPSQVWKWRESSSEYSVCPTTTSRDFLNTSFYPSDFGGPSYTSAADHGEPPSEESLECIEESKCRSTSRRSDGPAKDAIRRQSSADQTASLSSFPAGELKEDTGRFDFSTVQLAPVLECIFGISNWSLGEVRRRVLSAGSTFGHANRESKRDDEDLQRSLQISTGFGRRRIRAHHGSDIGRRRELPSIKGGRAYEADAGVLEDTQRWDGGRASWTKAAKIGRNHGTGWWFGICWCSTMWSGRQVSDSLIACRPASKQWLLNAVHLNDFVAPWEALDRAADLAWELGFLPHANLSFPVLEVPTPRRLNKKARFHDLVTLRMTTDKLETTYVIPDGLLSMWHCKPWTLACNTLDEDRSVSEEDETYFMQHSLHVQTHPDVNLQCTGPETILSDEVKEKMSLYRSTLATCPFVSYGLSETGV